MPFCKILGIAIKLDCESNNRANVYKYVGTLN